MSLFDLFKTKKTTESESTARMALSEPKLQLLERLAKRIEVTERQLRSMGTPVRAFASALAEIAPVLTANLIYGGKENAQASSAGAVYAAWRRADDAHVDDLLALVGWRLARTAFALIDETLPPENRELGYNMLMTVCGNLFGTEDRAMSLIYEWDQLLAGGYADLGGGSNGTYCIHPGKSDLTSFLWMANKALEGPELNIRGPLDPASILYLQTWTMEKLALSASQFQAIAREYLTR
jgi:hypothetical protein